MELGKLRKLLQELFAHGYLKEEIKIGIDWLQEELLIIQN